jgi:hypothetical protein
MAADKIGKISMFSDFNENLYLGLFWSEKLIGNDENFIQGHFYDATISKMATNKIDKLLMVFNDMLKARRIRRRRGIIIIIIITRFDCVWMQTQKFPNNPHIRIQGTNQFLNC